MKTFIFLFFLLPVAFGPLLTQEHNDTNSTYQTLFSSGSELTGWFIELGNSYSNLLGKEAFMPGFTGGVMLNNSTYMGLKFKSLSWVEEYMEYSDILNESFYLTGGYGGLFLEPGYKTKHLVHLTFPLLMGGGAASYTSKEKYPEFDEGEIDLSRKELSVSPFWILEPGINLEVNLTGFMRLSLGYTYRYLYGLKLENTAGNALNGGSVNLGIKIGKF